MAQNNNQCWQ